MTTGTRVFSDATQNSQSGCKKLGKHGSRKGAVRRWALENKEAQQNNHSLFQRKYAWNEKNLLKESSDTRHTVYYRYGADGQRALKSSEQSETLYFNTMWSWIHNSSAYNTDREIKHIYLGSERLVTRTNGAGSAGHTSTAEASTYYYHSDHLGSAHLITDYKGDEYERVEYTPYGEYWIEKRAPENKTLPFKFTGKERDEETGLYYYGARYLDPRTGRWLTTDPALGDYIPMAPVNDEAKKHNQNLPGMGGIYNTVNMHLYHYAGNNPVKYIDPDGKSVKGIFRASFHVALSCLTVAGGVGLMAASGAGEVASVGTATPLAVAGAAGGFALLVSGLTAFACSAAELSTEIADCFTDNVPNAEVFPSGIGGCIGAGMDIANDYDAQKEGKKGPNQVKGEAIETLITSTISTYSYGKSVADLAGKGMPTAKETAGILYNEASHQYDMYSAANAIGDLTNEQ